mmetsp:Transcript_6417/g.11380  ORF Transcript_6417/g.11380 Transcript_6417/m.11380 type:complete len:124 (-) Transcript_6417:46-417(-)
MVNRMFNNDGEMASLMPWTEVWHCRNRNASTVEKRTRSRRKNSLIDIAAASRRAAGVLRPSSQNLSNIDTSLAPKLGESDCGGETPPSATRKPRLGSVYSREFEDLERIHAASTAGCSTPSRP